ncbi:hypothetical protein Tco_0817291 [Tanacetum coccineum]
MDRNSGFPFMGIPNLDQERREEMYGMKNETVEGDDDVDEDEFFDDILNSQEDPDPRLERRSHKKSPEVERSVDLMIIDEEEEEK